MNWSMWICQRSAYFKFIPSTHALTCARTHTNTHTHTHTHSHTIWGPQTNRAKSGHRPKDIEEAIKLKDLHSVALGSDVRAIYWCICLSHAWNPQRGRPSCDWHFVSTLRQNVNSEAGLCFCVHVRRYRCASISLSLSLSLFYHPGITAQVDWA